MKIRQHWVFTPFQVYLYGESFTLQRTELDVHFPIWRIFTSLFGTVLLPDLAADWNGSGPFWVLTTNQRIPVHPGSDNPLRQEGVSNRQ